MDSLGFVNQKSISYKGKTVCFFLEYNPLFPFHFLVFRPNTQFLILFTIGSIFNLPEFGDLSRSNFASKNLVACFNNAYKSDKLSAPVHLCFSNLMWHSTATTFSTVTDGLVGYGALTPSVYLVTK